MSDLKSAATDQEKVEELLEFLSVVKDELVILHDEVEVRYIVENDKNRLRLLANKIYDKILEYKPQPVSFFSEDEWRNFKEELDELIKDRERLDYLSNAVSYQGKLDWYLCEGKNLRESIDYHIEVLKLNE